MGARGPSSVVVCTAEKRWRKRVLGRCVRRGHRILWFRDFGLDTPLRYQGKEIARDGRQHCYSLFTRGFFSEKNSPKITCRPESSPCPRLCKHKDKYKWGEGREGPQSFPHSFSTSSANKGRRRLRKKERENSLRKSNRHSKPPPQPSSLIHLAGLVAVWRGGMGGDPLRPFCPPFSLKSKTLRGGGKAG